ncbi:unnamed protein product [Musa hybrid cultivar]
MKVTQGLVVCASSDKTVSVEVVRLAPHPKYKRRVRKKKKYQAHDPDNQFKVGDYVQLEKSRPISKAKTFIAIPVPPRDSTRGVGLGLPLHLSSQYHSLFNDLWTCCLMNTSIHQLLFLPSYITIIYLTNFYIKKRYIYIHTCNKELTRMINNRLMVPAAFRTPQQFTLFTSRSRRYKTTALFLRRYCLSEALAEMWSPSTTSKDLDAGSPRYGRPLPRKSRPIRIDERASPSRPSSSAVPFSWEHRPGIPKTSGPLTSRPTGPLLPLPPSLRSAPAGNSRKKRPVATSAADPFATALTECAKDPAGPAIEELLARGGGSVVERRRRGPAAAWSVSDRLGLFGLYASCKATCAVADSAVRVPRSGPSNHCPVQR